MGSGRKKRERRVITALKMSTGREVTDPEEIRRLLIADGFILDEKGRLIGHKDQKKRQN